MQTWVNSAHLSGTELVLDYTRGETLRARYSIAVRLDERARIAAPSEPDGAELRRALARRRGLRAFGAEG